jgi:hypothetical protein
MNVGYLYASMQNAIPFHFHAKIVKDRVGIMHTFRAIINHDTQHQKNMLSRNKSQIAKS